MVLTYISWTETEWGKGSWFVSMDIQTDRTTVNQEHHHRSSPDTHFESQSLPGLRRIAER